MRIVAFQMPESLADFEGWLRAHPVAALGGNQALWVALLGYLWLTGHLV